jgi:hypothetical protein
VFDQTAVSAFTMQAPSKSASTHTTAHLFNKQQPGLHPTYTQQQPTNTTTNTHRLEEQLMDDDDDVSLSNDNAAHQSGSLRDDNSVASEESSESEESYGNNVFADEDDTIESPAESDYSCFTTGQKCVTS